MSIYPLALDGWDDLSTWGWDEPGDTYYAQLTRNGNSDDGGPEIWITPPRWPAMRSQESLASAIAQAAGVEPLVALRALEKGRQFAG